MIMVYLFYSFNMVNYTDLKCQIILQFLDKPHLNMMYYPFKI